MSDEPAAEPRPGGYDPAFFDTLIQAEERHFWFRHRNEVIEAVTASLVSHLPDGYRVLEFGCGTGNTLRALERACSRGRIVGMDLYHQGLSIARRRVGCALIQGDAANMPFAGAFDVVAAFDVLEHLAEDERVLRELRRRLNPGGVLIATVPAHMTLWSYADEAAHHCRRYAPERLRDVLGAAGYRVQYLTQFMAPLYPLVWLGRRLAASKARATGGEKPFEMLSRELRVVPGWNEVVSLLLKVELPLLRAQKTVPIGTSLLAVATRAD
jgi:SAM-dependent methyltransferase